MLSNFNLIYGQIKYSEIQRLDFFYEPYPFFKNIFTYFVELLSIPGLNNWTFFRYAPQFLLFLIIFISTLYFKEKKSLKLLYLVLAINLVPFLIRTEIITNLRNIDSGFLKAFHFEYITSIIPLIFSLILILLFKKDFFFKKTSTLFLLILILFQINSSAVPIIKKFIINDKEYVNVYTFNDYYMYDDYKKIKYLIKDKKTLSVGYDPMVAVMNNIYAIDGYHNIYPLHYKAKFRKIIENELNKNDNLMKYYDYWGNRLYAFINDKDQIGLNFLEAKLLGAEYIISKYKIRSNDITLIDDNFKNPIFLYKIN